MRVILTEGSSLTSRQVAQRLGELGHEVELLSSTKLCLSRFTRHVHVVHSVPNFGSDPFGWLDAAQRIASNRKADLLFPTQEQVTVLSAQEKRLTVPTVIAGSNRIHLIAGQEPVHATPFRPARRFIGAARLRGSDQSSPGRVAAAVPLRRADTEGVCVCKGGGDAAASAVS